MARIIAITATKGGSSKSTVAISMASEWHAQGKRVLLVDADPQGTLRAWGEVAASAGKAAPTIVAMGANLDRPEQLPALSEAYDVTIVDCPPGLSEIHRSALMVTDLAIIPCGPSVADAWALTDSFSLVGKIGLIRPDLSTVLLITRSIQGTRLAATAREALSQCRYPLLTSELRFRVAYQEALAAGQGVGQFRPRSKAADEARQLVQEVEPLLPAGSIHRRSWRPAAKSSGTPTRRTAPLEMALG